MIPTGAGLSRSWRSFIKLHRMAGNLKTYELFLEVSITFLDHAGPPLTKVVESETAANDDSCNQGVVSLGCLSVLFLI